MIHHRALILAEGDDRGEHLQRTLASSNPFLITSLVKTEIGVDEVEPLLAAEKAAIVFLCVERPETAELVARVIRQASRSAQIIAFSKAINSADLLSLMRCGVREWIESPVSEATVTEALHRIQSELDTVPAPVARDGRLFSFLPAKPGSGASTVAVHVAAACASVTGSRVALLDLDLNCGVQGFLLKLTEGVTITDAAEYADRMDPVLWEKMIARFGKLDVLRSGKPNPGIRIDPPQLHHLLSYAERAYPVTCVDLSGNWERYALDVMDRSTTIYQVCTTDLTSLHHARRNLDLLGEMNLRERVQIILNRTSYHNGLDRRAITEILGVEPITTLPNAFLELQKAIREGRLAAQGTPFSDGIRRFVSGILEQSAAPARTSRPFWKSAMDSLRPVKQKSVA
jgi:pilus assembly protein CpaE